MVLMKVAAGAAAESAMSTSQQPVLRQLRAHGQVWVNQSVVQLVWLG